MRITLSQWLERLLELPAFTARYALFQHGNEWSNLLTVLIGHEPGALPTPIADSHNYPHVQLRKLELDLPTVLRAFDDDHDGVISGMSDAHLAMNTIKFTAVQKASYNEFSTHPGLLLFGTRPPPADPGPSFFDPVVSLQGRYYCDATAAASDWCGLRSPQSVGQTLLFGIAIFIPDYRARITEITRGMDQTTFRVARAGSDRFILKGGAQHSDGWRDFSTSVEADLVHVSLRTLDASLLDSEGRVVDYARSQHTDSSRPVLEAHVPASSTQEVEACLRSGETNTVEYKPLTEPGHAKFGELVEASIAFMNTRGGKILIGVANDGALRDLQNEGRIKKQVASGRTFEEAVDDYAREVRQKILDRLARPAIMTATRVQYGGALLVVLDVPESDVKPICDHDGNTYVRAGATNRRIHSVFDAHMFTGLGAKT